jgi:hypothetical protein
MPMADSFALIGRSPKCGCPMAIDNTASAEAQRDFEEHGLLLEFVPEAVAWGIWEKAQFPCPHNGGVRHPSAEEDESPSQTHPPKPPPLTIYKANDLNFKD